MSRTSAHNEKKIIGKDLAAVLDENRRPLCFLSMEEILRQKLCHLRVAILVGDKCGNWLLSIKPPQVYDFSFCEIVPAQFGAEEYASATAMDLWHADNLTLARICPPCPENMHSYTYIYKVSLSKSMAALFARDTAKHILADTLEITALMEYGCDFSPSFKLFFKGSNLKTA